MATWLDKILNRSRTAKSVRGLNNSSILARVVAGSFFKPSSLDGSNDVTTIRNLVDTMRALAKDSQIATALSYYATDATIPNSVGQIIWATAADEQFQEVADIINTKFKEWNINRYARDHILELATIGNLYLPTTKLYRESGRAGARELVSLDHNTIRDDLYEVVPSTKLAPEDTLHLARMGKPDGFILEPEDDSSVVAVYDENAIIHFTLGGLMGDYTIEVKDTSGETIDYDIQFGQPLMGAALQPTQTLNLIEDALVLSSFSRIVRFINVECGNAEEEEIQATLQQLKDMIEQQLSINTANGDAQSFVNPQSPNNLIYLPKINGQDAISITDLNMAEPSESENKLLEYYQDKKLSVLGVPKEAMNFSSAEGLGGAGAVMSQRSALYGNSLQRIETAYKEGWTQAMNKYFIEHNLSGFVDKFELHMTPIVTQLSTVTSERRDSALGQAASVVDLLTSLGVKDAESYKTAITEILSEVLPSTGSSVNNWDVDLDNAGGEGDAF